MKADRRLWLTRDRARLVEDNDPEAHTLFCGPGRVIAKEDAERFGLSLVKGKLVVGKEKREKVRLSPLREVPGAK